MGARVVPNVPDVGDWRPQGSADNYQMIGQRVNNSAEYVFTSCEHDESICPKNFYRFSSHALHVCIQYCRRGSLDLVLFCGNDSQSRSSSKIKILTFFMFFLGKSGC